MFVFRMSVKSIPASVLLMAVLLGLDQAIKIFVRERVALHRSFELIPQLLDFTHVENRGVSFSVLGGLPDGVRVPLLVSFSSVAVIALTVFWMKRRRHMNAFTEWGFLLILPGAMGNLIDRAWFGTVTDFLHFRFYSTSFFVNNLADVFISLGVVAFVVGTFARDADRGF